MRRVLLLGAPERAPRALFGGPVEIRDALGEVAENAYAAVVVVNDGSADCVARLQAALDYCARHPGSRVAVLSLLDATTPGVEPLVRALELPGAAGLPVAQACALLRAGDLPVTADITPEAITFEYEV